MAELTPESFGELKKKLKAAVASAVTAARSDGRGHFLMVFPQLSSEQFTQLKDTWKGILNDFKRNNSDLKMDFEQKFSREGVRAWVNDPKRR